MRVVRIFVVLCLVGAFCVMVCAVVVLRHRVEIVSADTVESAPVAIVFGAKVKSDGTPSDILRDRLLTAIDLYDRGVVARLLLSGDDGQVSYDEVNVMRVFVLDAGVAPENVFLDHAGFDTYDTLARASRVFGVTKAILVTQNYHLPRALYIASGFGIDVQGVAADRQTYRGIVRYQAREYLADVKSVFEVVFHLPPTVLGPAIDLGGDGRMTWDEQ